MPQRPDTHQDGHQKIDNPNLDKLKTDKPQDGLPQADKPHPPQKESVLGLVVTVVQALLIALVIRTLLFQPFSIPSASLVPTLLIGDYLFTSKFAYGFSRYSLPWGGLIPLQGRIWAGEPQRGDVVVFKLPTDDSEDYIKRVVGLPGDTIQMLDNVLVINGKPVKRERMGTYPDIDAWGKPIDAPLYRETLPNGRSHLIMEREGSASYWANTFVYQVPAGHYFMMGDNRDNSRDSRDLSFMGYVPLDHLVGRAEAIFFSVDETAPAWQFWRWPSTLRTDRLFKRID